MDECLSRTIEIYRRDALQSDGNSGGENVASIRREKFTVRPIPKLTVNSGRKVQHPCGFPGDRRIGPADGESACSQAIARTVRGVSWHRAAQGHGRAGDETTCLSLIYRLHHQRQPLCDRRSTRGSRQRLTLATFHSRVVRSPRPLGIECPQCVGQPPHGRAPWRAAPRSAERGHADAGRHRQTAAGVHDTETAGAGRAPRPGVEFAVKARSAHRHRAGGSGRNHLRRSS